SRNVYLSSDERKAAASLSSALREAANAYAAGERDPEALRGLLIIRLTAEPLVSIDYAELVDPATFQKPGSLAVVAARLGKTRLIDNHDLRLPFPKLVTGEAGLPRGTPSVTHDAWWRLANHAG